MVVMVKSPKGKTSRITTACNPCRSRKQKCSGRRPNCEQCSESNRTCEWPEQLKRGPAKGYVEALEQRLQETEDVLLKVVSQLDQAQLESLLSAQNSFLPDDGSQYKKKSSRVTLLPSRKRGVEHWKSYPLRDAESIKRWQQDYYRNRSNFTPTRYGEDDSSLSRPVSFESAMGDGSVDLGSVEDCQNLQSSKNDTFPINSEENQVSAPLVGKPPRDRPLGPRASCVPSARKQCESNISQLSTWRAAPSKDFQQKFLW